MASGQDTFGQHIEHHFSQDAASDVTIRLWHIGQEHHFKVHRKNIAKHSCILHEMVKGGGEGKVVTVCGDRPEAMDTMLGYFYYEDLVLDSKEVAHEVCITSNKYKVEEIESLCIEYLINDMELEDVLPNLNVAVQTGSSALEEKSFQMLKGREDEVIQSQYINNLSPWALESLLKREDFEVSSEVLLFQAVIQWGKAKVQASSQSSDAMLRGIINRFLWSIRFLTMTLHEFMDNVESEGIFSPYESMGILKAIRGARVPRDIPCSSIREARNGTHHLLFIPLKSHQEADQGVMKFLFEGEDIGSFTFDHDILLCKIVTGYRGSLIIRKDDEVVSVAYSSVGSYQFRDSHIIAGVTYRLLLMTKSVLVFPEEEESVKESYGVTIKGHCRLLGGIDLYFKK